MSIYAHHVIDSLRGRGRYPILCSASKESKGLIAKLIEHSEKFDFGAITLEQDDESKRFEIPSLTDAEIEAWMMGLLPFPAPISWFEFDLVDKEQLYRSMLLIDSHQDKLKIFRFDFSEGRIGVFANQVIKGSTLFWPGSCIEFPLNGDPRDMTKSAAFTVGGSERVIGRMMEASDPLDDYLTGRAPVKLALYLNMMLYSQSTESRAAELPAKSRVKELIRERKGLAALPAHRVVVIVPDRFMREAESESKREKRPPRLHWRRSHLRHFDHQTGNSKWLSEHEHKGVKGWWVVLVARMLVGRADLGEVSHEYRVKR